MKFGKRLNNQIEETLPEWRDKFLSYKDLKKRLKLVVPKNGGGGDDQEKNCDRPAKRQRIAGGGAAGELVVVVEEGITKEEIDFIQLLEAELEKFNNFFMEKEEEYIIRLKVCFPVRFRIMPDEFRQIEDQFVQNVRNLGI